MTGILQQGILPARKLKELNGFGVSILERDFEHPQSISQSNLSRDFFYFGQQKLSKNSRAQRKRIQKDQSGQKSSLSLDKNAVNRAAGSRPGSS
jgi:hypothetical protein